MSLSYSDEIHGVGAAVLFGLTEYRQALVYMIAGINLYAVCIIYADW